MVSFFLSTKSLISSFKRKLICDQRCNFTADVTQGENVANKPILKQLETEVDAETRKHCIEIAQL